MMECYFAVMDPESGEIVAEVGPLTCAELELAVRQVGWSILQSLRIHRAIATLLDTGPPTPHARA